MQQRTPSGAAVGWTAFAAFMMIMIGFWWVFAGLVGIINDDFYAATKNYLFKFDTTAWGWIHLIVGVLVLLAGFGLFRGAVWARTVGVIMAIVSGIAAFAWLPWYPFWSIVIIVVAVAVIWALTAHGSEVRRLQE
jgi:hypothetical protein